ncbi:MAG: aspartate/glutamate racemase family protein [Hyphomicrobiaceae bacterium]|nr:aspartate/glutamate racemase family protein [Hyphomicrobiaceae bacterium]
MKKIGMIGGLSWVSTAAYYRLINEMIQKRLGGVNSAHLILESVNREEYIDLAERRGDNASARDIVLRAAQSVERGGAAFIVMACNGAHRFIPELETHVDIPFLHIAETTADAVKAAGIERVGLLGVRQTMEGQFYPQALEHRGISVIVPDEEEKSLIHETILEELSKNTFRDETRAQYVEIIRNLHARGAEGAILGCTEIPLLVSENDVDVPVFSTTDIHCRAAVEMALAR